MPRVVRDSGVSIDLPEGMYITPRERPGPRGGRPGRLPTGPVRLPAAALPGREPLLTALGRQDMELLDTLALSQTPTARGEQAVPIDLELADNENGVLLVEQDGVYSWVFAAPDAITELPSGARGRALGARDARPMRRARFHIVMHGDEDSARRRTTRNWFGDWVLGKIQVYVLKFAARLAAPLAVGFLERHARNGLVALPSAEIASWQAVAPQDVSIPADRPARVALFLHGTFSNTVGSFGGLGSLELGTRLLADMGDAYDAVLGYDHRTLSETPLQNATALLEDLERLPGDQPIVLDLIAYSRGGLVARSLIEHLLPVAPGRFQVERAVLVGGTNGGTQLAEPSNWHRLLDLYTNLASATGKALALVPGAQAVGALLDGMVTSVGTFAKAMATSALTEGAVPGLAAMEPDGDFVRTLNRHQPGQPLPQQVEYYAVLSEFDASVSEGSGLSGLPARLIARLADMLSDQLMREPNDLVVNVDSMTAIDRDLGEYITDRYDFGRNGAVHHLNYFLRDEVVRSVGRWLALEPESVPAMLERDFITEEASTDVATVRELLDEVETSYLHVRRLDGPTHRHYAFRADEVREALAGASDSDTLERALDLHEEDESPAIDEAGSGSAALGTSSGAQPTRDRRIVLEEGHVVGLVPRVEDLAPSALRAPTHEGLGTRGPSSVPSVLDRLRGPARGRGMADAAPRPEAVATTDVADVPERESQVLCSFRASMAREVARDAVASVDVEVSREALAALEGLTSGSDSAEVSEDRPIILQIVPRRNLELVGARRAEVPVPAPGEVLLRSFDLRATDLGVGELNVIARQGTEPLAMIALSVSIVEHVQGAIGTVRSRSQPVSTATSQLSPALQLEIYEQRRGADFFYHFAVRGQGVAQWADYDSAPIRGDRTAYVAGLYRHVQDSWLSSQMDYEAFNEEQRAFGGQLFSQLFPPGLQQLLWDNRDNIDNVLVLTTEPSIPWEVIHLKPPGQALPRNETRFLGQLGMVRWVLGAELPPRQIRLRGGRNRFAIPTYPDPRWQLPQAELEAVFLQERLLATPLEPQPNPVRRFLSEGGFDLFHFAGHGEAEHAEINLAKIMLEGRIEGPDYIPAYLTATTVEQHARLKGADGNRPLIVLNACQAGRAGWTLSEIGGFAQAFARAGAGAFVGALWNVYDAPARNFTEALYTRMLAGDPLQEAANHARETARASQDATWLAYTVYGNPDLRVTTR